MPKSKQLQLVLPFLLSEGYVLTDVLHDSEKEALLLMELDTTYYVRVDFSQGIVSDCIYDEENYVNVFSFIIEGDQATLIKKY